MRRRETGAPRKRPGRFRRWVVRPFVWVLVLLALTFAAGALYLKSDAAAEKARALMAARLSDALGRTVEVGTVRLGLAPLSLEVEELVVPGPEAGDRPVLVLPWGRIEVSLSDLTGDPVLHLDRLWLREPRFYLRLDAGGGHNLPRIETGGGRGGGRFQVEIGRLIMEAGRAEVNEQRLPLELDARGVGAVLAGTGEELELKGRFQARELAVTLPRAQPYSLAVVARVDISRGRIEAEAERLEGPDLSATARAVYSWNAGGEAEDEGETGTPREERRLHVEARADGRAELLTRLGYTQGEVAGPLEVETALDWNGEVWSLSGTAASSRLVAAERVLEEVEADLAGDPESLRVDLRRAGYADGVLAGVIRVGLGESPTPVAVDLSLQDVSVRRLAADQGLDLAGIAGRMDGDVTYRFTSEDPLAGFGWADLVVEATRVQGRRLSLAGNVDLTIGRGVVASRAIRLRAPGQRLLIEGLQVDLPTGEGGFRYQLDSEDVGRLAVLLPPPEEGEAPPAWLPTAGAGAIEGEMTFGGGDFTAEARLDLERVESLGAKADHLSGSMTVTPAAIDPLRLELTRDGGALLVTGRVPLEEPAPPSAGAAGAGIEITVDAASWPLAEARAFLPFELPVEGPVSGRLELVGPAEALGGEVVVVVEPVTVAGLELERARVELAFDPERVQVAEARLSLAAGEVIARGRVELAEDGTLDLDLESSPLALTEEPFAGLLGGEVTGTLTLTGFVTGTLAAPEAHFETLGEGLKLGRRSLGVARVTANWAGGELSATGSLLGLLSLAGGGTLTPQRADLAFDLASDDLRGLARLAAGQPLPGLDGSFSGLLTLSGELAQPRLELRLDPVEVSYEGNHLRSLEPVQVRLEGSRLVIDSLYLGEEAGEGEVFLAGEVGLEGEIPLDLRLQATASAGWAELFLPGVRLSGTVNALGQVGGTAADPAYDGQADLEGGELILEGFPHSLEELEAVALIYPDSLVLDTLRGGLAGGTVRAAGRLDLTATAAESYRLQLSAQEVRLRYPEGWVIAGDAELILSPTEGGRILRGSVDLDRAYYLQDLELGLFQLMSRFLRRQRLEVGVVLDPELAATQLNVVVNAPPGALRVRNNVADLRGSAGLVVRGTLARPVPVGQVEMQPGGTLVYGEAEYEVERGLLTFASLDRIDPLLDLAATTEVREYDVTLNLSGTLDRLNATFSSDPPLPDLEVLALLATGQRLAGGGELGGVSQGSSAGAEAFLYGQAASAVTARVKTLFGFDTLRIDPLSGAGGSVSSTRLIVGKQVSRDVSVTYIREPTSDQEDLVEARWQVEPGVVLVLTVIDGEQYAVEVQWERRF